MGALLQPAAVQGRVSPCVYWREARSGDLETFRSTLPACSKNSSSLLEEKDEHTVGSYLDEFLK